MEKSERIGTAIRDLRRQQGLTQEDLAERTDRSTDAISQIERGLNSPTIETVFRVAAALKMKPSALVERAESDRSSRSAAMTKGLAILTALEDRDLEIAIRQLECFLKRGRPE